MRHIERLACILPLSTLAFCQLPSNYNPFTSTFLECNSFKPEVLEDSAVHRKPALTFSTTAQGAGMTGISTTLRPKDSNYVNPAVAVLLPSTPRKSAFHWKRALFETFTFFSIEQAYLVRKEYHWVTAENGVPFNHYWSDYTHSLSTWAHSGWDDGDPFLDNYIGHPIQGALSGYIQVQNDPQGEKLEFSNSRAYWRSRLKAMLWNAAYSTQWEIGPLSVSYPPPFDEQAKYLKLADDFFARAEEQSKRNLQSIDTGRRANRRKRAA